jgi:hypothetical protein
MVRPTRAAPLLILGTVATLLGVLALPTPSLADHYQYEPISLNVTIPLWGPSWNKQAVSITVEPSSSVSQAAASRCG